MRLVQARSFFSVLPLSYLLAAVFVHGMSEDKRSLLDAIVRGNDEVATAIFHITRTRFAPEYIGERDIPLMYLASAYGLPRLTAALIDAGADPNVLVSMGGDAPWLTPLGRAVAEGAETVVAELLRSNKTSLDLASTRFGGDDQEVESERKTIDQLIAKNIQGLQEQRDLLKAAGRVPSPYSQRGLRAMQSIEAMVKDVRVAREQLLHVR